MGTVNFTVEITTMMRTEDALALMTKARDYTNRVLETIPDADWFTMPGGVTHVAWQVGHLAAAQYRLGLERIRGARPEDESIMPASFLSAFGRTSVPQADPSANPSVAEIKKVFHAVHQKVMQVIPSYTDQDLEGAIDPPHPIFKTKGEALVWMSQHELIHTGQIALLRRQVGQPVTW